MRGKNVYTSAEIYEIKMLLRKKAQALPNEAKGIGNQLRKIGFYLSDFKKSQTTFTEYDLENLITENIIKINDHIKIGNKQQKIRNLYYNAKSYIKSNWYKVLTLIVSIITLVYVIKADQTPPLVYCELELVQRPDSIYQAHIYIWNVGDLPAENVVFWARQKSVFLADTAKKKIRLDLTVYPYLSVTSSLTPSRVLSLSGSVVNYKDHRVAMSKLPTSSKYENYFIVFPRVNNRKKLLQSKSSVFHDKFINLKSFDKIPGYLEELKKSMQISADGKLLNIEVKGVITLSQVDTSQYYFPTIEDVADYRKNASAPYYTLPPLQIIKSLNEKGEKSNRFRGFSKFRGFKSW